MEGNITHLLLILVIFVLPTPLCAVTSGLNISMVVHVSHPRTWSDARDYCRRHHSDLVTIRNQQEANWLASFDGWIGLRRGQSNEWKWSRGDEIASVKFWGLNEPRINERCVLKSQQTWASEDCLNLHPFLCVDEGLILVQEMKTWEEALVHCRKLQAVGNTLEEPKVYDLASLPEVNNVLLGEEMAKAATQEVWVGLRFLAGEWFWVSGEAVKSSYLPHCPAHQQHCGALHHMDIDMHMFWEIMNCSEERAFLCNKVKEADVV